MQDKAGEPRYKNSVTQQLCFPRAFFPRFQQSSGLGKPSAGMAPHSDVFLLLAGALVLAASTVLCDTKQFLLSNMKKWDGARKACLQAQGKCDIAKGRTGGSGKIWDSLSLPADQPHWVGARMGNILLWKNSKQPFIQSEGCYQAPRDWRSVQRGSHTLNKNSPERCLSQCPTSMVALQNTTCVCLELNILRTLSKSAEEECNIPCQGDHSRCGDADNYASVYSIPERTVLKKKRKSGAWYWNLAHNNEHQLIVITNEAVKNAGFLCAVSGNGSYETRDLSDGCPQGSKNVTFENMDVAAFIESVSAMNTTVTYFASPLDYFRKPVWLDGTLIPRASGKGYCIALVRQTNGYLLTRRSCKEKLPAICACEAESTDTDQHTTIHGHLTARPRKVTTARTTQSTAGVSSTKEYSSSQSTTHEDVDSTSTTAVASSTSPVSDTTKGTTLHTSSHTSSQTVVTTQPPNTVTTQSYMTTKLTQPQKTVTAPPEVATNLTQPQNSATTPPDVTANLTSSNITRSSNDGPLFAPPMDIDAGQPTARETAAASTGLIAGITAGCVLLCIVVVVAVFLFKRKRRESSHALVKRDKSGHVSYPI